MTNAQASLQEKLEKRILHGLSCEWESALWVLKSEHSRQMKKPLFSLRNLTKTWGYWSAGSSGCGPTTDPQAALASPHSGNAQH